MRDQAAKLRTLVAARDATGAAPIAIVVTGGPDVGVPAAVAAGLAGTLRGLGHAVARRHGEAADRLVCVAPAGPGAAVAAEAIGARLVVVVADDSAPSVLDAYHSVKALALGDARDGLVLVVRGEDAAAGRACADRVAGTAQRFLGLTPAAVIALGEWAEAADGYAALAEAVERLAARGTGDKGRGTRNGGTGTGDGHGHGRGDAGDDETVREVPTEGRPGRSEATTVGASATAGAGSVSWRS